MKTNVLNNLRKKQKCPISLVRPANRNKYSKAKDCSKQLHVNKKIFIALIFSDVNFSFSSKSLSSQSTTIFSTCRFFPVNLDPNLI